MLCGKCEVEKAQILIGPLLHLTVHVSHTRPGTEVIKVFSCSAQLRMKFFLLHNVKMPTNVGILTFMSGKR